MERFNAIVFILCFLVILAESTPAGSSATLWDNAHDIRDIDNHHTNLLKPQSVQNNTKHLLIDENPVKNTTQVGEYAKDSSYLNKTSDSSTASTGDFSSSYIKDTLHSRHNGDREGDAYHKEGPSVDLSSYDILLDPSLILARLSRQAGKSDTHYSNLASIKNISRNIESSNHNENRNPIPSKRNPNFEDDLGVAEDRYQPPYPYRYPYYREQFPNQRYRTNDRREPYRNYLRYPVFPGK